MSDETPPVRLSDAEKRVVLQAIELGAQWEDSLAASLGDGEAKYRDKTEKNAASMRAVRAKLMRSWGFVTKCREAQR